MVLSVSHLLILPVLLYPRTQYAISVEFFTIGRSRPFLVNLRMYVL